MAILKLTKTVVDAAQPKNHDYELRDTAIPGFLLKVTPTGRKVFMVAYVANNGLRRKPAIGRFGELTVEQARTIAQLWLADVRKGSDPSAEKSAARRAPSVEELFERFISDYSEPRNKPSTVRANRSNGRLYILPNLGNMKASDVTRADIANLLQKISRAPTSANRVLSTVRKMFNMAEVWGMRPDGSNPCRHVPKYPERGRGKTRLITDVELKRVYAYLSKAETEGLEHPFILLAVRLQFEFAARMSEIRELEWAWVDLDNRRVAWPDSKTGGMSKPMSAEALRLFQTAPRLENSPYVCPSICDANRPMPKHTYYKGWQRILERAGVPPIGTHGIRHRSATDIANSGIPVKVGMALTAHKTVTMFMRYVHIEDAPVRAAAETVALRRQSLISSAMATTASETAPASVLAPETAVKARAEGDKPLGFDDGNYSSLTKLGNYRPFRHRRGPNRAVPPGTRRAADGREEIVDP
jgi:integrase